MGIYNTGNMWDYNAGIMSGENHNLAKSLENS